jgi:hypothetical protein
VTVVPIHVDNRSPEDKLFDELCYAGILKVHAKVLEDWYIVLADGREIDIGFKAREAYNWLMENWHWVKNEIDPSFEPPDGV